MATVTVFTADRMQEIEDNAIVDGSVVGDNLILTRNNATSFDAGNVRGPQGVPGTTGYPLLAGAVIMWIFPTIPSGFISLDGQSIAGANTLYPDLWAAAPSSWKVGTTLTVPNLKGKMPVHYDSTQTEFDALEESGGSKTRTLTAANVPEHVHGMDHDHPSAPIVEGSGPTKYRVYPGGTELGAGGSGTGGIWLTATSTVIEADIAPYTGGTSTGFENGLLSTPFSILPPYFVVRFIIKT